MPVSDVYMLPYNWLSCTAVVQAAQQLAADKRSQCAGKNQAAASKQVEARETEHLHGSAMTSCPSLAL